MFSQFYGIPPKVARQRMDDLLERFGLLDKADAKVRTISTGQKQKMNVIRGFVTDPDLILLDQPTLGLDVNANLTISDFLRKWVKDTAVDHGPRPDRALSQQPPPRGPRR